MQHVVLQRDERISPKRSTDEDIIKWEQGIVDRSNEDLLKKTSERTRDLEFMKFVLEAAWDHNDDLSIDEKNLIEKIRERTGGLGVDVAMEVVGITPTINTAIDCLRLGGSLGAVGNISATVDFPLQKVVTRELSVYGSAGSSGECHEALERIADGSIRVDPLISAAAPLSEGAEWFNKLYKGGGDLMKVILKP